MEIINSPGEMNYEFKSIFMSRLFRFFASVFDEEKDVWKIKIVRPKDGPDVAIALFALVKNGDASSGGTVTLEFEVSHYISNHFDGNQLDGTRIRFQCIGEYSFGYDRNTEQNVPNSIHWDFYEQKIYEIPDGVYPVDDNIEYMTRVPQSQLEAILVPVIDEWEQDQDLEWRKKFQAD